MEPFGQVMVQQSACAMENLHLHGLKRRSGNEKRAVVADHPSAPSRSKPPGGLQTTHQLQANATPFIADQRRRGASYPPNNLHHGLGVEAGAPTCGGAFVPRGSLGGKGAASSPCSSTSSASCGQGSGAVQVHGYRPHLPSTRGGNAGNGALETTNNNNNNNNGNSSNGLPRNKHKHSFNNRCYRDRPCMQFMTRGSCTYGSKCKYSHDLEVIQLALAANHNLHLMAAAPWTDVHEKPFVKRQATWRNTPHHHQGANCASKQPLDATAASFKSCDPSSFAPAHVHQSNSFHYRYHRPHHYEHQPHHILAAASKAEDSENSSSLRPGSTNFQYRNAVLGYKAHSNTMASTDNESEKSWSSRGTSASHTEISSSESGTSTSSNNNDDNNNEADDSNHDNNDQGSRASSISSHVKSKDSHKAHGNTRDVKTAKYGGFVPHRMTNYNGYHGYQQHRNGEHGTLPPRKHYDKKPSSSDCTTGLHHHQYHHYHYGHGAPTSRSIPGTATSFHPQAHHQQQQHHHPREFNGAGYYDPIASRTCHHHHHLHGHDNNYFYRGGDSAIQQRGTPIAPHGVLEDGVYFPGAVSPDMDMHTMEPFYVVNEDFYCVLSGQIEDFMERIDDELASLESHQHTAIETLQKTARGLWSDAVVEIYGSNYTRLALPSSDVDCVLVCKSMETRLDPLQALQRVSEALRDQDVVTKIDLLASAKIPVLKFVYDAKPQGDVKDKTKDDDDDDDEEEEEEESRPVLLDVTCGHSVGHSGLSARDLIYSLQAGMPALRPLVIILKTHLQRLGLNSSYTGGLSSYSLVLLVVRFLQACGDTHYRMADTPEGDDDQSMECLSKSASSRTLSEDHLLEDCGSVTSCDTEALSEKRYSSKWVYTFSRDGKITWRTGVGTLLLLFLETYITLDYRHFGISITNGGSYFPLPTDRVVSDPGAVVSPVIYDPMKPGRNIGNCFRIHEVTRAWFILYQQLASGQSTLEEALHNSPTSTLSTNATPLANNHTC